MATPKRMAKKQPEGGRVAEFLAVLEAHTKLLAFFFGLCFIGISLVLAVWFPKPTAFQYMVFRSTLALAAAGVGGVIPGMIRLKFQPITKLLIHAGGALALFVIVYFVAPADLKNQPPDNSGIKQSNGVGNQAIMIKNTGSGDVQVTATVNHPGPTLEQFSAMLKQHEERIVQKQREPTRDEKERYRLEQEYKGAQEKLANLQQSYEEELKHSKAQDEFLAKLEGKQPEAKIKKARADLNRGNKEAAKQVFAEVQKEVDKTAALAAYYGGQIAESEFDYTEAMRLYSDAVIRETDKPDYLLAAGNMARMLGDYAQAQEWLERLLKIRENEGENDVDLANAQEMLASLYVDTYKYDDAESLLRLALAIREKNLGKNHYSVAYILNNIAKIYANKGRIKESISLYEKSLDIAERPFFQNYNTVAVILNGIAELNTNQGNYTEAEQMYKRALAIFEKLLGKEHPDVATVLNNLAALYYAQGRYAEAEQLCKRSLEIREEKLGKDHPDVATTLNNLAALYYAQGKYDSAEPLYKRSLAMTEKVFGKDHPDVATTLNNLATLYRDQGKYQEAEPLYKRSLAIREQKLGKEHPDVAMPLNNLAMLYHAQGRYAEAEPLYKRSLEIREQKLGKEHPDVAMTLNNLAMLYQAQRKYTEAESLLRQAIAIMQAKYPGCHTYLDLIQKNYDGLKREMVRQ